MTPSSTTTTSRRAALTLPRQTRWLSRAERGLIAFLEECGSAQGYLGGEQS